MHHPSASCYCRLHLLTVSACGIASSLRACSTQPSTFNLPPVLLSYQSSQRYTTRAIHQSTRRHKARTQIFSILDNSTSTTLKNISTACIFSAQVDGAWLTLISISNSLRLQAPLTVVPTSHLYLHSCGQRKSNSGLTPHPSTSVLVNILHTTLYPPLPPTT